MKDNQRLALRIFFLFETTSFPISCIIANTDAHLQPKEREDGVW